MFSNFRNKSGFKMLLGIGRLLFHRDAESFKWPIKRAFLNPCLNWVSSRGFQADGSCLISPSEQLLKSETTAAILQDQIQDVSQIVGLALTRIG